MIATTLAPKTSLNRLSRKIHRIIRQPRSLKVKASDVDSYGDYDIELISELIANQNGMNSNLSATDVSDEELEKLYHLFLS